MSLLYNYSFLMGYTFNPHKMTYKMALFVQKNVIFPDFYFDNIMASVCFSFYVGLPYF